MELEEDEGESWKQKRGWGLGFMRRRIHGFRV